MRKLRIYYILVYIVLLFVCIPNFTQSIVDSRWERPVGEDYEYQAYPSNLLEMVHGEDDNTQAQFRIIPNIYSQEKIITVYLDYNPYVKKEYLITTECFESYDCISNYIIITIGELTEDINGGLPIGQFILTANLTFFEFYNVETHETIPESSTYYDLNIKVVPNEADLYEEPIGSIIWEKFKDFFSNKWTWIGISIIFVTGLVLFYLYSIPKICAKDYTKSICKYNRYRYEE
ncbi:MAG: hypothetical protein WC934_02020 [Acidithiobacillus sp.]|jgi:hypothetical protein|uniref:hypothetical protein n=1 Tax=Acidithiobacillus sp. TaxID=1872118 RepID=UPI00355CDD76